MAQLLTGTRIYGTGTVDTQLFVSGTNSATSTTTGALQVVGGVGVGGNLHVGGIIYGEILGTATTATNADNVKTVSQTTNASYYPVFVDSNNSTAAYEALYTTSSFVINPQSGNVGVGTTSPSRKLDVEIQTASLTTGSVLNAHSIAEFINLSAGGSRGLEIGSPADSVIAPVYLKVVGTGSRFAIVNQSDSEQFTILTGGNVGIGFTAPNGKLDVAGDLYVGATQNTARFKSDNTNTFVDAIPGAGAVVIRAGGSVEKLRVTANGGISFGASGTAYGTSGQILQSNGDAAPTWISTGSLAAANATTATHLSGGVAGQIPYQTAPGVTAFLSTGTAGDVLVSNGSSAATYNNTLRLAGATNATSTSSGALQVVGGVGVGGDLFIQGDIRTNDTLFNLINANATTVNFAGDATTLTMGASGSGTTNVRNNLTVNGNLTVQGTTTIVDSTVTNIADPIITLGGGTGNTAPTADDNKDRGVAFKYVSNAGTTSTGFFGYDDSTGYLTYVPSATITNEVVSGTKGAMDVNLAGGTAMSIHYQSAADTTAFLAAGSSGYLLQTNGTGSAPTWVSASGVSAGSATNADNIRTILQTGNTSYYPTFVDSNNASAAYESLYTTSSFSINPATGAVSISGFLTVSASSGAGGIAVGSNADRAQYQYINFGGSVGGVDYAWQVGRSPSAGVGPADGFYIYDIKGSSTRVSIDGSGNVGIGTTTPRVKLAIDQGAVSGVVELVNLHNQSQTSGHGSSLTFSGYLAPGSYPAWRFAGIKGMYDTASAGANASGWGGQLRFFVNRGAAADDFEDVLNITTGGRVGIGTSSPGGKLHIALTGSVGMATATVSSLTNVTSTARAGFSGLANNNDGIYFGTGLDGGICAGLGLFREASGWSSAIAFYTNNITDGTNVGRFQEKMRITSNGGISFGASQTAYGTSGQVLQSNGDAPPTWINQSSITSGGTSLTSTYVGFGSGSNLLTGSSSLTWNGTTLYVNGRLQNAGGLKTYSVATSGQGNVNAVYEIMKISRDNPNWSSNVSYEITVRSAYYPSGGYTKWLLSYGYANPGTLVCMYAGGGTGMMRVYLGAEVTVNANCTYKPVFVDIPPYMQASIEVRYSTTEVATVGAINSSGQVFFSGIMTASGGTGAFYSGDTHLVPNGGNVGIGTTTPPNKLTVSNGGAVGLEISPTGSYTTLGGVDLLAYNRSTSAYAPIGFITNASNNSMVILTNGNVGIGTTAPSGRLHLYQTSGGSNILTLDTNFVNGNSFAINPFITGISNGGLSIRDVTNSRDRLVIQYSTGYIGINSNTNPSYLIDTAPLTGTTTDTDRMRWAPYNGPAGGTSGYGATAGGGTNLGTGIVWAPNYSGYSKRSAGILNIAEGNYFRSGLAFYTNNITDSTTDWTEAMRIGSNGNVSIGAGSNPGLQNKFDIYGSSGQLFSVSDSFTGTIFSANDVSGIPSIEVLDTGLVKFAQYGGQVGISTGTVVSGSALSVYGIISTIGTGGEIRASSEITAYYSSDRRLKENIKLIENPITIIDQIRGVTFDWTDEHMARRGGEDGYFVRKHDIGVIAQEVQAVLPELVGTREDGYLAVKYEKLVPLLIEAVKEQQKTIETLTSEIKEIKEFLSSLKNN